MDCSIDFIEYAQERLATATKCFEFGNYTDELYNLKKAMQEIEVAIRKAEYEQKIQEVLS